MTIVTEDLARTLSPAARELIEGPTNWIDGAWEDGEESQEGASKPRHRGKRCGAREASHTLH